MVWPRRVLKVIILCLAAAAGFGAAGSQTPAPSASSGEAAAILSAARDALGGDKRISSLKTIVTTGRTRQVQGDNLVPIEFEITIELPDKYVRTDEIPARESGPSSRGFNGDGLIQIGEAPDRGGRGRGGPPPPPGAGPAPARGRHEPARARQTRPVRHPIPRCR